MAQVSSNASDSGARNPSEKPEKVAPHDGEPVKPEKTKEGIGREADRTQLVEFDIGVWNILMEKAPFSPWAYRNIGGLFKDVAPVLRLLKDVYLLGPWIFVAVIFMKLWWSLEPLVLLALSSRLLRVIEEGLRTGKSDTNAIVFALAVHLSTSTILTLVGKVVTRYEIVLQGRVQMHFEDFILQHKLRLGVHGQDSNIRVNAGVAWQMLDIFCAISCRWLELLGHISFLWNMSTSGREGLVFVACCLAKPALFHIIHPTLWERAHVQSYGNEDWSRLKSLETFGRSDCREEVITNNLMGYILQEYGRLRANLKDARIDWPTILLRSEVSPMVSIIYSISKDLPMVYFAAHAILGSSKLSLSSIATLQQASSLIRGSFRLVEFSTQQFKLKTMELNRLYSLEDIKVTMKEGALPYPSQEREKSKGMAFELSNVSFSYPMSKTKEPALKDISCSIKSGQMVVIVGANGSGKSTLIKLLNRLYDPTSGGITVDGNDIASYRLEDYRNSVATLTQDHSIFDVSIGENIGLGYTEEAGNTDLVMKAAEQGGAKEVIAKFKDGLATTLKPTNSPQGHNVTEHDDTPLGREFKNMNKIIKVSGGEKQRLVASRIFMRFQSGRISFVAVDEPSSAMDPEAEYQLFRNLRQWREGKTMIFVTHRFGHLTKHADLILCMKEGTIVESGTHGELIGADGEYSKLYKIQAEAFEGGPA